MLVIIKFILFYYVLYLNLEVVEEQSVFFENEVFKRDNLSMFILIILYRRLYLIRKQFDNYFECIGIFKLIICNYINLQIKLKLYNFIMKLQFINVFNFMFKKFVLLFFILFLFGGGGFIQFLYMFLIYFLCYFFVSLINIGLNVY